MTAIEVNNNYSMTLAEIKELNKEISKFENNMENLGKEDTLFFDTSDVMDRRCRDNEDYWKYDIA